MFSWLSLGGSFAPRSDCSPPPQDQERAQGTARQAQGVPAGEGEAGGGQDEEAQGGPEKTVPRHGPDGPEKAEVQPEGGDAGRLSDWSSSAAAWTVSGSYNTVVALFYCIFLDVFMKIGCKDMTIKVFFFYGLLMIVSQNKKVRK